MEAKNSYDTAFTDRLSHAINTYPFVFVMSLYTFIMFLTLVGLLHYHCGLIARAETTNENIRNKYQNTRNPYDYGCWRNFNRIFCSPIAPSSIQDFVMGYNPGMP